jgi:ribonuclease inhibitor
MSREIVLDAGKIMNKVSMGAYMREVLPLPEYFGNNLDALHDVLSEVEEDTVFYLTEENVRRICSSTYAYRVLLVISDAAEENPHLRILFR